MNKNINFLFLQYIFRFVMKLKSKTASSLLIKSGTGTFQRERRLMARIRMVFETKRTLCFRRSIIQRPKAASLKNPYNNFGQV